MKPLILLLLASLACASPTDSLLASKAPAYTSPLSNSKVVTFPNLTSYQIIDTTSIFKVVTKINSVTLLEFPARVKLAVIGNTAEFKTTVEGSNVYVKPLIMNTTSNLHVNLYSGEIITIELSAVERSDKFNQKVTFTYPEFNPFLSFVNDVTSIMSKRQENELQNLRDNLGRTLPQEFMKDLTIFRCSDDRDETSLKYEGYQVFFDAVVSNKQFTYFYFHTNATPNENCPVSNIEKIEVKTKTRDKMPIDLTTFVNTGDKVIVRTPVITSQLEEMKLFITVKFFNVSKTMKVVVY